jgi:hypothetical protein
MTDKSRRKLTPKIMPILAVAPIWSPAPDSQMQVGSPEQEGIVDITPPQRISLAFSPFAADSLEIADIRQSLIFWLRKEPFGGPLQQVQFLTKHGGALLG